MTFNVSSLSLWMADTENEEKDTITHVVEVTKEGVTSTFLIVFDIHNKVIEIKLA